MSTTVFQITDALLLLEPVDKLAVGYTDLWQSPGGKALNALTAADFPDADSFSCQITSGKLTSSKQSTTIDRPATFCGPASSTVQPGETRYTLDADFLQDIVIRDGWQAFLAQHDAEEAFFLLSLDGATNPPRAAGRVNLHDTGFGGAPRANLTDSVSFDCTRKPDRLFGRAGAATLITGAGVVTQIPA